MPFDFAQGGEPFDFAQDRESFDREPVERLVEPFEILDLQRGVINCFNLVGLISTLGQDSGRV